MQEENTELLYSPHPPIAYSRITPEGYPCGIGRELSFAGRRPWWNLYWLSDPAVDDFLGDDEAWSRSRNINSELCKACSLTARTQKLGGVPVAQLLLTLTPTEFVARLKKHKHAHLAAAKVGGADWLEVVTQRAQLFRGALAAEGTVVYANFGRRPADKKVEQSVPGSVTIMPLSLKDT